METVKPCSVCCVEYARFTCMLCGRLVCPDCYEPIDGVCRICAKIPREKRLLGGPDIIPIRR